MKKNSYAMQYRKMNRQLMRSKNSRLNRKRMIWLAVLLLWMFCMPVFKGDGDWFYKVTSQLLPLVTYEQEHGLTDMDYAANYQVPEWFYEDEGETMAEGDQVQKAPEGMDNQKGTIETPDLQQMEEKADKKNYLWTILFCTQRSFEEKKEQKYCGVEQIFHLH